MKAKMPLEKLMKNTAKFTEKIARSAYKGTGKAFKGMKTK
jgi:hypothetical protein